MKFTQVIAGALVAATGISAQGPTFAQVPLEEPLNYEAGPSLFPGNVIAGYSANLTDYADASAWNDYILAECKSQPACTSTLIFSGLNSGTPKNWYWFGYTYRGGPTTPKDYVRGINVQDSIAYTIVQ